MRFRRFRRTLGFLILAAVALAQTSPVTMPTVAGNNVVTKIAASGTARWITFLAPPSNSSATCGVTAITGCPRIGDSSISTSRGVYILPGQSAYLPESPGVIRQPLNGWYYLVQTGDSLVIQYGQ